MEEGSSAVDILKPEGWRIEGVEEGEHGERRVIVKVGS